MSRLGLRFSLSEFGGAFGDAGTLVPLLIALIAINGMHPAPVLLLVGVAYIGSGLFFRLPISVQPLKAVAAIAIALGLSPETISASGLLIGAVVAMTALTGAAGALSRLFPRAVIRGVQLGVGMLLLKVAYGLVSGNTVSPVTQVPPPPLAQNLALAIIAVGLLLLFLYGKPFRRVPASLAVLGFGLGIGLVSGPWESSVLPMGMSALTLPGWDALSIALVLLVVPQLPLTLGNSVFGAADTARMYFGEKANRVTHRNLLLSIAGMNLAAGVIGGMPLCHGSGGITAHHRLGARTGGATVMLGALVLMLVTSAIFWGTDVLRYLSLLPYPVLGVMLAFVGVQHGLLARKVADTGEAAVAILVGVVTWLTGNLAAGFSSGIVLYYLLRLAGYYRELRG
ncbi:MAG: putative sulfate/molybdate transporter [Dehalococcoidia bacterium]|nr:putative sulfate/molybdate transporter [Dehalococcoidia bacterium]